MDPPRTTRRFQNWCREKEMWHPTQWLFLMPLTQTTRHSGPRADKSVATDVVNPRNHGAHLLVNAIGNRRLDLRLRGDDVMG